LFLFQDFCTELLSHILHCLPYFINCIFVFSLSLFSFIYMSSLIQSTILLLCVCLNGVWNQGFVLTKQVFYHLCHITSSFCSCYFGDRGLLKYLPQLASSCDPPDFSQIVRI
jgi:hypothetical protein